MKLECIGPGRVEIVSGSEAHSAEALEGNFFEVDREDGLRVYGKLIAKGMFTCVSGIQSEENKQEFIGKLPGNIVCAVLKENVRFGNAQGPFDGFWALWREVK